jgi:hypothetical protein
VHITWQCIPNPIPNDEDYEVLMKYHFYIINEKTHNIFFSTLSVFTLGNHGG